MTARIDAAADPDFTDIDVTDTHSTADQTGQVLSDVCGISGSGGTGGRSTPTLIPPHTWAVRYV